MSSGKTGRRRRKKGGGTKGHGPYSTGDDMMMMMRRRRRRRRKRGRIGLVTYYQAGFTVLKNVVTNQRTDQPTD